MAVFLDKLKQRGVDRFQGGTKPAIPTQPVATESPLPSISQATPSPLGVAKAPSGAAGRISKLPQRGTIGSLPENVGISKRILADLPSKDQLVGIQRIINGEDSTNSIVNNFVKGQASQGKTPEQIRQAFINQEKTSKSPLVLL